MRQERTEESASSFLSKQCKMPCMRCQGRECTRRPALAAWCFRGRAEPQHYMKQEEELAPQDKRVFQKLVLP